MLEFKEGVNKTEVAAEIWFALGVAARVHRVLIGNALVVTAMRDGNHMANSLHFLGRAADIRTVDIGPAAAKAFYQQIWDALHPLGFDVVNETTPPHIHIEYDPKPKEGRAFPAVPGHELPVPMVNA